MNAIHDEKRYHDKRIRSGDEPIHARSPVRLRLGLALFGLVTTAAAAVLFVLVGHPGVAIAFAVVAVLAAVDVVVASVRIRQGPHFQPGPDVPPYRPVDRQRPERRARDPVPLRTRRRVYTAMMGVCVTLILLAWVWIRLVSTTAAIAMSAVAAVIPPVAAVVANARGDQGPRR
jgi:Flp pilus assembly protein TadB